MFIYYFRSNKVRLYWVLGSPAEVWHKGGKYSILFSIWLKDKWGRGDYNARQALWWKTSIYGDKESVMCDVIKTRLNILFRGFIFHFSTHPFYFDVFLWRHTLHSPYNPDLPDFDFESFLLKLDLGEGSFATFLSVSLPGEDLITETKLFFLFCYVRRVKISIKIKGIKYYSFAERERGQFYYISPQSFTIFFYYSLASQF